MPRALAASRTRMFRPAYAGEREWLVWERGELFSKLTSLSPQSHLRPGIEHVIQRVTTRLMEIEAAEPTTMPAREYWWTKQ